MPEYKCTFRKVKKWAGSGTSALGSSPRQGDSFATEDGFHLISG